jgi:alkanesulfonate monooxygenase SsuD/methylene tetrahydromethanopterin reductase-like flavin-dependent oxidoreductase (luciferase family)
MKYGAFLPCIGPLARGDVVNNIRTTAQTAEALGFDSIWTADHIVTPLHITSKYPYTATGQFPLNPKEPLLDPLTTLSRRRLHQQDSLRDGGARFASSECSRDGKTVATLDVLSNGRVILGVGVGWMEEEFKALNVTFSNRGPLSMKRSRS